MTILIPVALAVALVVWWFFWLRYKPWYRRHGFPEDWEDAAYVVYIKARFMRHPLVLAALIRDYAEDMGFSNPRDLAYPRALWRELRSRAEGGRWPGEHADVLQDILSLSTAHTGRELAELSAALDETGFPYADASRYVHYLGAVGAADAIRHGIPVEYAAAL